MQSRIVINYFLKKEHVLKTVQYLIYRFVPLIQGAHPLSDAAFTASSILNNQYSAKKARVVPGKDTDRTWLAGEDDAEQYLQIDFNQSLPIYGILVRGNPLTEQFVTSYKVLFSNDGFSFSEATDIYGVPKVLSN
jgi:hypothetical protein